MSIDPIAIADDMEAVLRSAGSQLRDLQTKNRRVLKSEGKDIKLEADLMAEKAILTGLRACSPYPVLSEEKGWLGDAPGPDGYYWVVDPLDGSYNFLRGQPACCSSVALCQGEKPVVGAIYDFNTDRLYVGGKGVPARVNGEALEIAHVDSIGQACLMTGLPVGGKFDAEGLAAVAAFIGPWKKVRMIGSATLALAYVASGLADFYREDGIFWWDVAAGIAIIEAAGGTYAFTGDAMAGTPLEVRAGGRAVFEQVRQSEE